MIVQRSPFIIHHFARLGSTNDQLKSMTEAPEYTCVVADEQTAGRGRHGRRWISAPGAGLYLSVLFRPPQNGPRLTLLSLLSGVAAAEALLERDARSVDLKWPNDVILNDRKVGGVLIEVSGSPNAASRVVVGIGINLNQLIFPEELGGTATSLANETGRSTSVADFRDALLDRLAAWYRRWLEGDAVGVRRRWEELSSYARGAHVRVSLGASLIIGVTDGLAPSGALRIQLDEGGVREVTVGEVTRLRRDDPGMH
jgi:BirA family biotin operon repressor/biotin-[acetyl-CoA-carboxylase] ligase